MSPKKFVELDNYAQNARAWRDSADIAYSAATRLFETHDLLLIFPAATLGHHALEMYLKAALICEGCAAFNPKDVRNLDPSIALKKSDCVWGHNLVALAKELAKRRTDFDLTVAMTFLGPWQHEGPPIIEAGFGVFNPFFDELRYPHELTLSGVGEDDRLTLDELVRYLQPFLAKIK